MGSLLLAFTLATASAKQNLPPTLEDLWQNKARFEAARELQFGEDRNGRASETASWFTVGKDSRWYAFSRVGIFPSVKQCPHEHMRVVVRESDDKGKTWSRPVVAVEPGASKAGDTCAVLDGSTYFDEKTGEWHLLAQCLDRDNRGGWALCHYMRRSPSPLGEFTGDAANPVIRGGQLWSRICGAGKSCPQGLIDEGTPDIVERRSGLFTITMHGFDPRTGRGYRGVVQSPDFRAWYTSNPELPGDSTLSAKDCEKWFGGCVGFGEAASLVFKGHIYIVAETMDRTLLCTKQQRWFFVLMRSPGRMWPRSGSAWQMFRSTPFINASWRDPETACKVAYAKWIIDRGEIYLVYEDWEPDHARLHRRLLKLVWGPSSPAIVSSGHR